MTTASVNWLCGVLPYSIENQIYEALTVRDLALTRRVSSAAKQTLDNPAVYNKRLLIINSVSAGVIRFVETHHLERIYICRSVQLRRDRDLFQNLPTTTTIQIENFRSFTEGGKNLFRSLANIYTLKLHGYVAVSDLIWLLENNQHHSAHWLIVAETANVMSKLVARTTEPFVEVDQMDISLHNISPAALRFLSTAFPNVSTVDLHLTPQSGPPIEHDLTTFSKLKFVTLYISTLDTPWSLVKLPKLRRLVLEIDGNAIEAMWQPAVPEICKTETEWLSIRVKNAPLRDVAQTFPPGILWHANRGLQLGCENLDIRTTEAVFGATLQAERSAKVTGCKKVVWIVTGFTHRSLTLLPSSIMRVFEGEMSFFVSLDATLTEGRGLDEEIMRINDIVLTPRNETQLIFYFKHCEEDTVMTAHPGYQIDLSQLRAQS